MKKMELELPGSVELTDQEMRQLSGGLAAAGWWALLWSAVSNFGDIREGVSDGFAGNSPRY